MTDSKPLLEITSAPIKPVQSKAAAQNMGARCGDCPLRDAPGPVMGELRERSIAIVAQEPGDTEIEHGRPLVGPTGHELMSALSACGMRRDAVSLMNVVACRSPGSDGLKRIMARVARERKRLKTAYGNNVPLELWPITPVEACRPRLEHELSLAGAESVLALGGMAAHACSDELGTAGILSIAGTLVDRELLVEGRTGLDAFGRIRKMLPTVNPAFVMGRLSWRANFRRHVGRAFRWFQGRLAWQEPEAIYQPSPQQLRNWLAQQRAKGRRILTCDVETEAEVAEQGFDCLTDVLRCIGFGTADAVAPGEDDGATGIVISFLTIQGAPPEPELKGRSREDKIVLSAQYADDYRQWARDLDSRRLYAPEVEAELVEIIAEVLADPYWVIVGHNCLYSGTPVRLADGTSAPIERLVREKYTGEVRALDAHGRFTTAKVTGWVRNRVKDQEWIVIRRHGEKGHARGLTLTPDHQVFTTRGRIRADGVRVGDEVLSEELLLDVDQRQALLGTLLGDSSATAHTTRGPAKTPLQQNPGTADRAALQGVHVGALADEKAQWLPGLLKTTPATVRGFGVTRRATRYALPKMRQVADIAQLVYTAGGKRKLTVVALEALGAVGLAWWFADDGCKHKRSDRRREPVLIAACRYTDEEREVARTWFSARFGGYVSLTAEGSIRLGVVAAGNFAHYIAPYLLPAARYKLPKGHGALPPFGGFPERCARPLPVEVVSVAPWTPPQRSKVRDVSYCIETTAGNFLTGFGVVKNCAIYDAPVIKRYFGVWPTPMVDTLVLHKAVEPEQPHNLGYVGAAYTDVHAWKAGKLATTARTDSELQTYNLMDVVVTARVAHPLAVAMRERQQERVVDVDHGMQFVCVRMHENGMPIDQGKRQKLGAELRKKANHWANECRAVLDRMGIDAQAIVREAQRWDDEERAAMEEARIVARQRAEEAGLAAPVDDEDAGLDLVDLGFDPNKHNPNSFVQVGKILFGLWDLPIPSDMQPKDVFTDSGSRSTGDAVLRMYLPDKRLDSDQRAYVHALRQFRKASKLLGTYVTPMRFRADIQETSSGGWKGGLVWPDGRIRPGWNILTRVGRLSSSGPNAQNWSKAVKIMVVAPDGRVLVYADQDQLHLRIIANRWKVPSLIEAFALQLDPHGLFAESVFGDTYRRAKGYTSYGVKPEGGTAADMIRDVAKRHRYAGAYKAQPPTIWRVLLSAEDKQGNLVNPSLQLKQVYATHDAWMDAEPEWEAAWKMEKALWLAQGYVESPLLGRRVDLLDGNENDIVNAPILMAEGDIMSLMTIEFDRALLDFNDGKGELGRRSVARGRGPNWKPAMLINQCHDSIMSECDEADGDLVAELTEQIMSRTIPGWDVPFSATAQVGRCWAEF